VCAGGQSRLANGQKLSRSVVCQQRSDCRLIPLSHLDTGGKGNFRGTPDRLRRVPHRHHNQGNAAVSAQTWWIASLFSVGSLCFALGPLPPVAAWLGDRNDALVFVFGAICFTSAASLSFLQVVGEGSRVAGSSVVGSGVAGSGVAGSGSTVRRWRQPESSDWWADGIQLIGTLAFNVTTVMALAVGWSARQENVRVWAPDMIGSVCFLLSSAVAMSAAAAAGRRLRAADTGWWIAVLNLCGSAAFGLAAIAALVLPASGGLAAPRMDNLGTSIGGFFFLAASLLLVTEAKEAGT
jgi:hypothetical protein